MSTNGKDFLTLVHKAYLTGTSSRFERVKLEVIQDYTLRIPEVTLVAGIGKEQRVFFLAKYILMEIAPFFRGALERNWFLEGRNNRVMLPEDDVYVWKKAVDFLNTGDFYPRLNIRRSNVSYVGRLHTAPMAHGVFEIEAIDVWC